MVLVQPKSGLLQSAIISLFVSYITLTSLGNKPLDVGKFVPITIYTGTFRVYTCRMAFMDRSPKGFCRNPITVVGRCFSVQTPMAQEPSRGSRLSG